MREPKGRADLGHRHRLGQAETQRQSPEKSSRGKRQEASRVSRRWSGQKLLRTSRPRVANGHLGPMLKDCFSLEPRGNEFLTTRGQRQSPVRSGTKGSQFLETLNSGKPHLNPTIGQCFLLMRRQFRGSIIIPNTSSRLVVYMRGPGLSTPLYQQLLQFAPGPLWGTSPALYPRLESAGSPLCRLPRAQGLAFQSDKAVAVTDASTSWGHFGVQFHSWTHS